ncbi:MAG: hypothetical protein KIT58_02570 [Planctomycetota bacterium]|nr:hypothetical protein [Planctomycetota bacterium]
MVSGEIHVGDLLSEAWAAFSRNAGAFIGATALAGLGIIACALPAIVPLVLAEALDWHDPVGHLALSWGAGAAMAVYAELVTLGLLRMSLAALRGQRVAAGDVLRATDVVVPGLVSGLIAKAIIAFGMLACLIPGLLFACSAALTAPFVADKRLLPWPAIQASRAAAEERRLSIAITFIVAYVVVIVGAAVLCVGLLVAAPLAALMVAGLYERLWPRARPEA